MALLEGDWLFHSHLFKLWPLGGALVKHSLHLAGLLVISPGTPKNDSVIYVLYQKVCFICFEIIVIWVLSLFFLDESG